MTIIVNFLIASRGLQFFGLTVLTFVYLFLFPYTGPGSYFDVQVIFDFTFLGIPRALDIASKLINGTIDFSIDPQFPLKLKFNKQPINNFHNYDYDGWTWDYKDHPKPDHKSMIGPYLTSFFTLPWSFYQRTFDKLFLQSMTRLSVSIVTLIGFAIYCSSVTRKFGHHTTSVLTFLTMSQFYFLFNLSRLVPNSLSMFMVLVTTASWFSRRNMTFIALATITVVGFHSVTILLFIPMVFYSLVIRKTMPLGRSIIMCASVSYLTFITTSLLDSYMWGEYVWSQSKLFKDLLNRSTIDLGFSTLTWYTLIALPRYLLFSIIFVPFASRRCIKSAFMVSYSYLVLCSLCNYKDFGLVIYCYPLLNTCAANAIAISFYRFFTLQPHTESWLLYLIRRKLGYQVTSLEEFEAEEKKMDDQEKLEKNRDSFWDNITIDRSRNDSVNLYEPLAPAEWLALGPPPYTSTASSSPPESPEETPLTSDVHLQLNQSPRVRKPIQSSPTNFLRRRGGLRKALTGHKSVTTCNTHRDDQTSDDQSTSIRPKRIPIETDSIIHSEASHFGSVLAALVTFQFLANAIAVFYYASTTRHCYPGGEAVAWLNEHIKQTELPLIEPQEIGVYLGKRTVETGYTRFLQINGITYDTSSDIYTLAIKDQRLQKYHNKFDSNERNKNKRTKNDGQNFDFKVIYFILDRVDGSFFNLNCRSHPSGQSNGETIIQPLNTIISTDQDSKFCKLSHELVNCPIIKIIDSYGGLELSRLHISIGIIREPTLWIIKCLIPN